MSATLQVTDVGSLNGTTLNGRTISTNNRRRGREHRLSSDDLLQLGSYTKLRWGHVCLPACLHCLQRTQLAGPCPVWPSCVVLAGSTLQPAAPALCAVASAGPEGHGVRHEACLLACRVTAMPADIADGDMPLLPKRVHTPPSTEGSFTAEERRDNPQTPVTPSPEGGRLLQR